MSQNNKLKTIPVPQRLFEIMADTYQNWEKFSGEFEDFLLAKNSEFIEKIRKARKEHRAGKLKSLKIFKQGP